MPTARDAQRSAVYAAEEQWAHALDRGGLVDFHGSRLQLPVQLRFGSLADASAYVNAVTQAQGLPSVRLRVRAGDARAHYERAFGAGQAVIAVPAAAWAMRESVLLHEIAHHVVACAADGSAVDGSGGDEPDQRSDSPSERSDSPTCDAIAAHGPQFAAALVALVEHQLGAEAALLLRTGYVAAGVSVDALPALPALPEPPELPDGRP